MDDNYAGGEEVDLQAEVYMVQAISGERERDFAYMLCMDTACPQDNIL